MSGLGAGAKKEKDEKGFYTVDLVETFFSKIDLLWFPVLCTRLLGEGRKGRGGGSIHLFGDGPEESVEVEEGYFIRYFFGSEGWTFM